MEKDFALNGDKKRGSIGIISALVSSVVFGLSFMFVKQTVSIVSAFSLLSWRFLFAFAAMSICVALGIFKVNFKNKNIWPVILMALFQPVCYFLAETFGIDMTTASESGTIMACIPLVTLVFSTIILKEPPTKLQTVSIILSVVGVLLIVLIKGMDASFNPIGYLLLVAAVMSDSFYVIFARKASNFTSFEKTYVMAGLGACVFTLCALIENGINGTMVEFISLPFTNMDFLSGLLYLSIGCQIIGFLLNNFSLAAIGANRTASFAGISTIVSVAAGVIVLGEGFSVVQGIGTLLVLVGVYGTNITPKGAKQLSSFDDIKQLKAAEEKSKEE